MSKILRFVADDETTVRLELNAGPPGFILGRGFDLGIGETQMEWLEQKGVNGAVLASTGRPPTQMVVPLILPKQTTVAAMITLIENLNTELDRRFNILEFRPSGTAASYFIDTYRSPLVSLFRGEDVPAPETLLMDPKPIPVTIWRHPIMRGAGTTV